MIRRALLLCVVALGALLVYPAAAQKGGPANRVGEHRVQHDDEYTFAPVPAQAVDRALVALMDDLSKAKLKPGALDAAGLEKALREKLQGLKPPEKLKVVTAGVCNVIDPHDPGGYWNTVAVRFENFDQEHTWEKTLDVDEKRFALAKPPTVEVKYVLEQPRIDDGRTRPFRRDARVLTNYYMLVKITVTIDGQAVMDNASEIHTGVANYSPPSREIATSISLADREQ